MGFRYKDAGVDVEAGYQAVNLMKKHVKKTFNKNVIGGLGSFGGMYSLDVMGMDEPVMVAGTDGVGTKLQLAFQMDKHDTIGMDCVAMCVNDIVCQGAKPLFFLDYIATGKMNPVKFARLVPDNGYVVGCSDDARVKQLLNEVNCHTISFGIDNEADWIASDIEYHHENTSISFRVSYKRQDMGHFILGAPGKHNIYNALAAAASAWTLGIPLNIIKDAIASYKGTHRRFEIKGISRDVIVIDDYAHHPTEIKATLRALKEHYVRKIWCVFQPHTYTRTKKLFNEFVNSFEDADQIIITDIYAAREKDTGDIHARDLAKALADSDQSCIYISDFCSIVEHLLKYTQPDDIILTMGAGNVYQIADSFLKS